MYGTYLRLGVHVHASWHDLGSGLIDHNQKTTAAAMQIADMKVWAQRS